MIQYISFYDHELNKDENRAFSPAGKNVTEYVANAIGRLGYQVEIISPIQTKEKFGLYRGKQYNINNNVSVVLPPCFGAAGIFGKILKRVWQKIIIYIFLFKRIKNDSVLIIYHSLSLLKFLSIISKIKKCKIILQVEEIYGDVENSEIIRKREMSAFKKADAFIFPTISLSNIINIDNKPNAIVYGDYSIKPLMVNKFNDGKIHCLYAGTFDKSKGGVFNAIDASIFLNDEYVMHILGFGSNLEIEEVKKAISLALERTNCKIIYEGLKSGDDFRNFVQKCDIGLSTQNPEGRYNDTSFPSKVLMYLTNGLDVVSVDLQVLHESKLKNVLHISKSASGIDIANAILKISPKNNSELNNEILNELDYEFMQNIDCVIRRFNNEI